MPKPPFTPKPKQSRLTQTSERQSKQNAMKKLDAEIEALEIDLSKAKEYKEDPFITKLREEQSARMNLGEIKGEPTKPKTSHIQTSKAEINKNEQIIQKLESKYNTLKNIFNKLVEMQKTIDKPIESIKSAINNQIYKKKPNTGLESEINQTSLKIGDNFVGLGANITSKNFSDTGQVKETLNTVEGRTSPLGKAEEYKENIKKLSSKMDSLNDQLHERNLTSQNPSNLLEMLEKLRTLRANIVETRIKVKQDMSNVEIDIKYIRNEEPKKNQPTQDSKQKPPVHTR